jgi:hypothetical protein
MYYHGDICACFPQTGPTEAFHKSSQKRTSKGQTMLFVGLVLTTVLYLANESA